MKSKKNKGKKKTQREIMPYKGCDEGIHRASTHNKYETLSNEITECQHVKVKNDKAVTE